MAKGTKVTYGLESSDSVRLVMSESMARMHGAAFESWRQRLFAGEVVPCEDYEGPELSVAE